MLNNSVKDGKLFRLNEFLWENSDFLSVNKRSGGVALGVKAEFGATKLNNNFISDN